MDLAEEAERVGLVAAFASLARECEGSLRVPVGFLQSAGKDAGFAGVCRDVRMEDRRHARLEGGHGLSKQREAFPKTP